MEPPEDEIRSRYPEGGQTGHLGNDLSLAAIITPNRCIVAGTKLAVKTLQTDLRARGEKYRTLFGTRTLNCHTVAAIRARLADSVSEMKANPPEIPFISCKTGTWITDRQATDVRYWLAQAQEPARFADGMEELFKEPEGIFLEVGPERILCNIANRTPKRKPAHIVLPTTRHPLGVGLAERPTRLAQLAARLARL